MSLAQILGLTGQTKIPKRFQPFYQQAGSEALVRYAPEWDNLSQLRAQSAQTMRQRVAQARTAGAILNNAAGMAIKDIQANPNASSPALQSLLPMLTQRQQDAPIVANQQALQATNEHLQDLDSIHAKRASLLGQIGTFTIGRATDLVGSDRKLRHDVNTQKRNLEQQQRLAQQRDTTTRRGQDLSHTDRQASLAARKQAAAQRKKTTGKDQYGNTIKDRRGAQDSFDRALRMARTVGGDDWKKVADFLVFKNINPVMAIAAAQQAVIGHVGPNTATEIRKRGVSKGYKRHVKPGQEPVPPGVVNTVTSILG